MSNSIGIGTFIPPGLTSFGRRYALPDKAVQSQVLMYRQLLHTQCKLGLRLSRSYEATPAQKAVMHMPWWEHGVETTKRMVISYDNLIVRLWLNGCIMPYVDGGYAEKHSKTSFPKDSSTDDIASLGSLDNNGHDNNSNNRDMDTNESHVDTLIKSNGLPPIPHAHWVDRLGFQQTDPVTDFRSGGVLSLAMLVHIVEKCPNVHARFLPSGDTHMLPFGITCINVTDMIAKFCMFAKSTNQMDALISQKPFWRMFEDPNCLLALQELGMDMLCDVVVEFGRERRLSAAISAATASKDAGTSIDPGRASSGDDNKGRFKGQDMEHEVTVFDFAEILSRTEKRVGDELLGSGPKTVDDLRRIHLRLCTRYMKAIDRKERQAYRQAGITPTMSISANKNKNASAGNVLGAAGDVLYKFKELTFLSGSGESKDNEDKAQSSGPPRNKKLFRGDKYRNNGSDERVIPTEEVTFALPPQEQSERQVFNKGVDADENGAGNDAAVLVPPPSLQNGYNVNANENKTVANNRNEEKVDFAEVIDVSTTTHILSDFSIGDDEENEEAN